MSAASAAQPGPASLQVMDEDLAQGNQLKVPTQYRTVSEAVQHAKDGDSVVISAGHYKECVRVWGKRIELVGEGSMQELLIEGDAKQPTVSVGSGASLRIFNLMLQGSGQQVIDVSGGSLQVEDSNISGASGSGLRVHSGGEASVRRSVLCRCQQHGMHVAAGSRAKIESCSLFENGECGMLVTQGRSSVHISRCMVSFNRGVGIAVDQEASATIEDNDLRNNVRGPTSVGPTCSKSVQIGSNLT